MRVARSLSLRILLVALVAAGAGFAGTVGVVGALRWAVARLAVRTLQEAAEDPRLARCDLRPEAWFLARAGGLRVYAYDAESLRSYHPLAPSLSQLKGGQSPARVGGTQGLIRRPVSGAVAVLRVAARGPCSLLALAWPPRSRTEYLWLIGTGVVSVVSTGVAMLGFWFVVRPFLHRVKALDKAAEAVGRPGFGQRPAEEGGDELDSIFESLARAHIRIERDGRRLASRLKSLQEHLTHVAHDLRTPLASLQAHIEEALDVPGRAEASAVLQPALEAALRDCVYMAGLCENLRLASQLQEGWSPVQSQPVALNGVVRRVLERLSHYARRRSIGLDYAISETTVQVYCEPFACEQVVANLVENALNHLPTGGRIGVVLDVEEAQRFRLTVVDDGPGVAPAAMEQLSQRTFRSEEARARDPRGSGLGLAIVNVLCERCGWTVTFSQAAGGGLQVVIEGHIG